MGEANYELEFKHTIPLVGWGLYGIKVLRSNNLNGGPKESMGKFLRGYLLVVYNAFAIPEIAKGLETLLQ